MKQFNLKRFTALVMTLVLLFACTHVTGADVSHYAYENLGNVTTHEYYQALYDVINNAVAAKQASVTVDAEDWDFEIPTSLDFVYQIYRNCVLADHPEYFWADPSHMPSLQLAYDEFDPGTYLRFTITFPYYNELLTAGRQAEFDEWVEDYMDQVVITDEMTEYEIALLLHDVICQNVVYDTISAYNQSAYSAFQRYITTLDDGTTALLAYTVCAGYARGYQLLLQRAGIEATYVSGTAYTLNHAWVLVKLDGQYYYVDPTWDDLDLDQYSPSAGQRGLYTNHYRYFMISAEELYEEHVLSYTGVFDYPETGGMEYWYYNYEGLSMSAYSPDVDAIVAALRSNGYVRILFTEGEAWDFIHSLTSTSVGNSDSLKEILDRIGYSILRTGYIDVLKQVDNTGGPTNAVLTDDFWAMLGYFYNLSNIPRSQITTLADFYDYLGVPYEEDLHNYLSITGDEIILVPGGDHFHVEENIVPYVAPTCTEEGHTALRGCYCGWVKPGQNPVTSLPALGHNYDEDEDWLEEMPPDCITDGEVAHYYCSRCEKSFDENGDEIVNIRIPSLGHDYDPEEWVENVAATCTEAGVIAHYHCNRCNKDLDQYEYILPTTVRQPLGHTYTTANWIEEVPASCYEEGVAGHFYCTRCKKNYDANDGLLSSLTIDPLGHDFDTLEWTEEVAPTPCTTPGTLGHFHCSLCGDNFDSDHSVLDDLTIAPPGHQLVHHDAVAATKEADGNVEYWTCSVCHGYFLSSTGDAPCEPEDIIVPFVIKADLDGDGVVTDRDVVYVLYSLFFPDTYPQNQSCDFDGNGVVNDRDAVYLLYHLFFPDTYPLTTPSA